MSDVNFQIQVLKMHPYPWSQTRDKHQLHDSEDISLQEEIEGCPLMLQFKQAADLRALSAVIYNCQGQKKEKDDQLELFSGVSLRIFSFTWQFFSLWKWDGG